MQASFLRPKQTAEDPQHTDLLCFAWMPTGKPRHPFILRLDTRGCRTAADVKRLLAEWTFGESGAVICPHVIRLTLDGCDLPDDRQFSWYRPGVGPRRRGGRGTRGRGALGPGAGTGSWPGGSGLQLPGAADLPALLGGAAARVGGLLRRIMPRMRPQQRRALRAGA